MLGKKFFIAVGAYVAGSVVATLFSKKNGESVRGEIEAVKSEGGDCKKPLFENLLETHKNLAEKIKSWLTTDENKALLQSKLDQGKELLKEYQVQWEQLLADLKVKWLEAADAIKLELEDLYAQKKGDIEGLKAQAPEKIEEVKQKLLATFEEVKEKLKK